MVGGDAMTAMPHVWSPDESLSDVLTALGYTHTFGGSRVSSLDSLSEYGLHIIKRDGVEVYSSTRTNAYELCVLWLLRTRQVALTLGLERVVDLYRWFGFGEEIDAALSTARKG